MPRQKFDDRIFWAVSKSSLTAFLYSIGKSLGRLAVSVHLHPQGKRVFFLFAIDLLQKGKKFGKYDRLRQIFFCRKGLTAKSNDKEHFPIDADLAQFIQGGCEQAYPTPYHPRIRIAQILHLCQECLPHIRIRCKDQSVFLVDTLIPVVFLLLVCLQQKIHLLQQKTHMFFVFFPDLFCAQPLSLCLQAFQDLSTVVSRKSLDIRSQNKLGIFPFISRPECLCDLTCQFQCLYPVRKISQQKGCILSGLSIRMGKQVP